MLSIAANRYAARLIKHPRAAFGEVTIMAMVQLRTAARSVGLARRTFKHSDLLGVAASSMTATRTSAVAATRCFAALIRTLVRLLRDANMRRGRLDLDQV